MDKNYILYNGRRSVPMCTCAAVPVKLGVPLDEEHLNAMGVEERNFFLGLLAQGQREIRMAEARGEHSPFVPSNYLRGIYRRALTEHNGGAYCQVRQMQVLFLL